MASAVKRGDKNQYWVRDVACIGRGCFAPGTYQTRGATMSGSRNTGHSSDVCMTNAYRGCPSNDVDERQQPELLKQRRSEGWKTKN